MTKNYGSSEKKHLTSSIVHIHDEPNMNFHSAFKNCLFQIPVPQRMRSHRPSSPVVVLLPPLHRATLRDPQPSTTFLQPQQLGDQTTFGEKQAVPPKH